MYKLFLDDIRNPSDVKWVEIPLGPWAVVRNYDAFVKHITDNGLPEFIAFDHDLADEHYRPSMYNRDGHYSNYYTDGTFKERTGYHCAQWLVEYCMDNNKLFPKYVVHSMNPIGKANIIGLIENFNSTIK